MKDDKSNSGNCNSGNYNSGDRNSGNCNSGNYNSGDRNSGNRNSGHYNSGHYNSGNCNSGDYNSGNYNSGHYNSGNGNSGNRNSGNGNSGHYNSGNCNSGDYNSGNRNSGFFCTETPNPRFFDKESSLTWGEIDIPYVELPTCCTWIPSENMSETEKQEFPNHETLGGYLRSSPMPLTVSFPIGWAKLSPGDQQKFLNLPNFDADKFLQITGVDVRNQEEKPENPPQEMVINGVKYVLAGDQS